MMNLETEHARQKYQGETAATYEAKRQDHPKWIAETRLIRDILSGLPKDTKILDIPCGTGRFFPLYTEFGLTPLGMDINSEMSNQARDKGWRDVRYGNVTYIPLGADSVDVAFCIRLFNWISADDVQKAIRELQRVARKQITFTLRVAEHPRARPLSLVEEVLEGWKIARNDEIEGTFRMLTLEPV